MVARRPQLTSLLALSLVLAGCVRDTPTADIDATGSDAVLADAQDEVTLHNPNKAQSLPSGLSSVPGCDDPDGALVQEAAIFSGSLDGGGGPPKDAKTTTTPQLIYP